MRGKKEQWKQKQKQKQTKQNKQKQRKEKKERKKERKKEERWVPFTEYWISQTIVWQKEVFYPSIIFIFKGMEHVQNIFMSFDKNLF